MEPLASPEKLTAHENNQQIATDPAGQSESLISVGTHPALSCVPNDASKKARDAKKQRMATKAAHGVQNCSYTLAQFAALVGAERGFMAVMIDGHRCKASARAQFLVLDDDIGTADFERRVAALADELQCAVIIGETATPGHHRAIFILLETISDSESYKALIIRLNFKFGAVVDPAGKVIAQPWLGFRKGTTRVIEGHFLSTAEIMSWPAPPTKEPIKSNHNVALIKPSGTRAEKYAASTLEGILRDYYAVPGGTGQRNHAFVVMAAALIARQKSGWPGFETIEAEIEAAGHATERGKAEIAGAIKWAKENAEAVLLELPELAPSRKTKRPASVTQPGETPILPTPALSEADLRVNLRYISELPLDTFATSGVYLIASVQDTGKTKLLERLVNHWSELVCRGVVHRVTLTAELARRLECESQLDLFPEDQMLPRALITTLPSIVNQIDSQTGALRPIDVLFIDEVEQVLGAIFSPTIDKRERLNIFSTLVTAIKRARYVVCLDADAGSVSYDFLKSIRDDVKMIVNDYQNTARLMQTQLSKEALQKALYKALEDNREVIGVPCTSDKFATKLARKCAKIVGAEKVMLVCADTKNDPTVREFLKNPDANADRYRVVIYTSAMGSGVDISNTHAAAVFGFFGRQPLTAWDMHQMLMRFRHADTYNVWVDPVEANLPTSEQVIFEKLLDQEQGTKEAVLFNEDGIDLMRRARLQLAQLQAAVTARENQSKRSVRTHFLTLASERYSLIESSDEISGEQRQQILSEMKAIGEVLAEEYEQRLLTVDPVPEEEYKQYAIQGDITPEIEAGHVREQIEHLYAQEINPPAIHDFDEGKGIRRLKLLESLYKPQSEAVAYDRHELSDRVPLGDMTHATNKRMLLIEALRLFVHPDRTFAEEAEIDIETINQALGDFRDTHERDIRRYFGWRPDYSSKPINLLRFLLSEVGLKLEEVNADRQRLYRERKALQKQGLTREEAIATLPAPLKRYRLERSSLAKMERYISQRRERSLQESVEDRSLPLCVREVAA